MSLLLKEIEEKKIEILNQSSNKEKVFYYFLRNEFLCYPDETLSEEDQICYSAFCSNAPDKKDLVEKLRARTPLKGFHYSNNIITLSAFAKYNIDVETQHLNDFSRKHGLKERFIINWIFPAFNVERVTPRTKIEIIINDIILDNNLFNSNVKFVDGLKAASDLIDIFILEKAYLFLIDLHPVYQEKREYKQCVTYLTIVCDILEKKYFKKIAIVIGFSFLIYVILVFKFWSIFDPLFAVTWVIPVLMWIVLMLIYQKEPPNMDKKTIIKRMREYLLKRYYLKIKLDYDVIKKFREKFDEKKHKR
jgi:hypothetical protein